MRCRGKNCRSLTHGEAVMVNQLFSFAIDLSSVKIHEHKYAIFQSPNFVMTPNGEIYFPSGIFAPDFASAGVDKIQTFMHEMVHVWQHQMGMWVKTRGVFSWYVNYKYELQNGKLLSDYGMEKQAGIISDYYLLITYGLSIWKKKTYEKNGPNPINFHPYKSEFDYWMSAYQNNLQLFLKNPRDKKALFR